MSGGCLVNNDELISRFLEETGYDEDQDTLLILAYGSRIMGTNDEHSDLDVLVVSSKNISYRRAMFVDGIPLDITVMPLDDMEKSIYNSVSTGSSYYTSIFKHGRVVLDRMNTFETMQNILCTKVKRHKNLDSRMIEKIEYHIREFTDTNSNIHYFKALECLRKLHHVNNNCSYIRFTKVYDLYNDRKKATDLYMLKLPSDDYINAYLNALSETDYQRRLEFLMYFSHEFEHVKFKEIEERYFFDEDEIRMRLYNLNSAIWKCEDMLLHRHPYAKALYYMLIDDIYSLYELMYGVPLEIIDVMSDSIDTLIDNLEELFHKLDKDYHMDYNDVILRL